MADIQIIKTCDKKLDQDYTVSISKSLWLFDRYLDLTINQLRILYSYFALINPKEEKSPKTTDVEIEINWIIKQFKLEKLKNEYKIIKAVQEWKDINIWTYLGKDVKDTDSDTGEKMIKLTRGTKLKVFDVIEIYENKRAGKIIHLKCSDEFIPYAFPQGSFVEYNLNYITEFSSPKQITLYEILKDLMNVNYKKIKGKKVLKDINYNTENKPMLIGINNLVYKLQLDEKFKSYKYLNKVFLKPCIEKIKIFTDLKEIEYGKYDKKCPYYRSGYEIRKDERDKKNGEKNDFNLYFIVKSVEESKKRTVDKEDDQYDYVKDYVKNNINCSEDTDYSEEQDVISADEQDNIKDNSDISDKFNHQIFNLFEIDGKYVGRIKGIADCNERSNNPEIKEKVIFCTKELEKALYLKSNEEIYISISPKTNGIPFIQSKNNDTRDRILINRLR